MKIEAIACEGHRFLILGNYIGFDPVKLKITFDALFDKFRSYLDSKGLSFNEGKIIDASFVEAPRQRNTREESSDMCKSTNTSRSLLPLWDSRVLTSNEWINEHFREPTMPFEALKPTEMIQKVRLPLTNINF